MSGTTLKVCDIVRYGFRDDRVTTWRVTHHMRKIVEEPWPERDPDSIEAIIDGVVREHLEKEREERRRLGLRCDHRIRYQWCRPEEATHVELYSLCGCIAPVEACEFVEVVAWSPDKIAQEQADAVKFLLYKYTDWMWE